MQTRNNMLKEYIRYIKDNPRGYWFKRKLYGWGWVPVRWQGWLVIAAGLAVFIMGMYIGKTGDAPSAVFLGFLLMMGLIFLFGLWKGEKPRWQWGPPKEDGKDA